jgi:hypothetical protein
MKKNYGEASIDLEDLGKSCTPSYLTHTCSIRKSNAQYGLAAFNEDHSSLERATAMHKHLRHTCSQILLYAVIFSRLLLAPEFSGTPTQDIQDIAVSLLDQALLAAPDIPSLQDEVALLAVEWWQAELPRREALTPQTVPYLLLIALE